MNKRQLQKLRTHLLLKQNKREVKNRTNTTQKQNEH
jgi:hypothetical protein